MPAKVEKLKFKKDDDVPTCKLCGNPVEIEVFSPDGTSAGKWCRQHGEGVEQELNKGVSG